MQKGETVNDYIDKVMSLANMKLLASAWAEA